jgi:hypothetical protein
MKTFTVDIDFTPAGMKSISTEMMRCGMKMKGSAALIKCCDENNGLRDVND